MKLDMEVRGKVENIQNDGPHYYIHLVLTLDGQEFKFQGNAFIPAVEIDEAKFNGLKVGDIITLEQVH